MKDICMVYALIISAYANLLDPNDVSIKSDSPGAKLPVVICDTPRYDSAERRNFKRAPCR